MRDWFTCRLSLLAEDVSGIKSPGGNFIPFDFILEENVSSSRIKGTHRPRYPYRDWSGKREQNSRDEKLCQFRNILLDPYSWLANCESLWLKCRKRSREAETRSEPVVVRVAHAPLSPSQMFSDSENTLRMTFVEDHKGLRQKASS